MLMSILFIFTNIVIDEAGSRYIATAPVIFAILIIRYWNRNRTLEMRMVNNKLKFSVAAVLVSLVMIAGNFTFVRNFDIAETEQVRLGYYLEDQGLTHGYASFWNASSVTVSTHQKVNVRAVISSSQKIAPFIWFCKDDWYTEETNFVVVRDPDFANFGITEKNATDFFGDPEQRLVYEDYVILVYDYNLSGYINTQ